MWHDTIPSPEQAVTKRQRLEKLLVGHSPNPTINRSRRRRSSPTSSKGYFAKEIRISKSCTPCKVYSPVLDASLGHYSIDNERVLQDMQVSRLCQASEQTFTVCKMVDYPSPEAFTPGKAFTSTPASTVSVGSLESIQINTARAVAEDEEIDSPLDLSFAKFDPNLPTFGIDVPLSEGENSIMWPCLHRVPSPPLFDFGGASCQQDGPRQDVHDTVNFWAGPSVHLLENMRRRLLV